MALEIIHSIQNRIYEIRGQKVMLDRDLAALYKTETKALNLAVKRNINRFPSDFMFQLTKEEFNSLRFQIETSNGNIISQIEAVFAIFLTPLQSRELACSVGYLILI